MRTALRVPQGGSLLEQVEFLRNDASRRIDDDQKSELGQFLTPAPVAQLMASMPSRLPEDVRLLEPGAGVGSLVAALIDDLPRRDVLPESVFVRAYEIDPLLREYLTETLRLCQHRCEELGVEFSAEVRGGDFLSVTADEFGQDLFAERSDGLLANLVLMNPPYGKINRDSEPRRQLSQLGVETSNLYTGFLAASAIRMAKGGQMIAITPRSFCNGPYFRAFRKFFLERMAFRRIHVFESRRDAFEDEEVLQENVIFRAVRSSEPGRVEVTSSPGADTSDMKHREIDHDQLVWPDDENRFIHIVPDEKGQEIADLMSTLGSSIPELGLTASTGRVVAFRAKEFLRDEPGEDTVPLIYPNHLELGSIDWPKEGKKPNAFRLTEESRDRTVPNDNYVLVKRFTAKEERRRLVAGVYEADAFDAPRVGFENHLNYVHRDGQGIDLDLARGLVAFLNSTLADRFFRQFSGHTQVNATDLKMFPLPEAEVLQQIGADLGQETPEQRELDAIVETAVLSEGESNPVSDGRRIEDAQDVLRDLGLPRAQQNERSALTLLALLDLRPDDDWSNAGNPLHGIHDMLQFFSEHYGVNYAENTRETVRRQTVHQFIEAGIVRKNPDRPERPTNSPNTVYQIDPDVLSLARQFSTDRWDDALEEYLETTVTLAERHARPRDMDMVPVEIPGGENIHLSPGEHHELVAEVVEEFGPRFTPGGSLLYVGDTAEKFAYCEEEMLAELGVEVAGPDRMPDVVIHYTEEDWLVLVEAVTSHGPVSPTRRSQLDRLFEDAHPGLVYVTAFPDRRRMVAHLNEISWETEVWVAEAPDHLIHFDGERFLGPY